MHISEGILTLPILAGGAVLGLGGVAYALRRLPPEKLPQTAILASAFFTASIIIHVPVPPIQEHLILNGLLGLILGWASFPAIFIALALQALFFSFGGLTTLGINTLNMALPAVLCGFFFRPLLSKGAAARIWAGALSGIMGIALSALMVCGALAASGENFYKLILLILLAHIPVMLIEAVITAIIVTFLFKAKPQLLSAELP
jgi:cobalt/nickel transport system permease protein